MLFASVRLGEAVGEGERRDVGFASQGHREVSHAVGARKSTTSRLGGRRRHDLVSEVASAVQKRSPTHQIVGIGEQRLALSHPDECEDDRFMAQVAALPTRGGIFADARGEDRLLRVTWHHEVGVAVLSLWRDDLCVGSFRLAGEDVPALVNMLVDGLAVDYQSGNAGRQVS